MHCHNDKEVERFRGADRVASNVRNRLPAKSPLNQVARNNLPSVRVSIFSLRVDQKRNRSRCTNAVIAEE